MVLKLHLTNGNNIWADQENTKRLQKNGKVCCILKEYEENTTVRAIQKRPNEKKHEIQWL
ncbi:MAG: hypothetical protein QM235_03290 [Pseudomonadota bacterium]|jgi:hypothetical protein|nr:hypothetical protein [Pseudomonadota bacterium]